MLSKQKAIEKISRKFNNVPYNPQIIYTPHTFINYFHYKIGIVYGKLIQTLFENPIETIKNKGWVRIDQTRLSSLLSISRDSLKKNMATLVRRGVIQKRKTKQICEYRPLMVCANQYDLVVNEGTWYACETITKHQHHLPVFIDIGKHVSWYSAVIYGNICLQYQRIGEPWFSYPIETMAIDMCFEYHSVFDNVKKLINMGFLNAKKVRQINYANNKKPWGFLNFYCLPQETKKMLRGRPL